MSPLEHGHGCCWTRGHRMGAAAVPSPLKGCGIYLLPLPFAPQPEALVSGCKAESSAAAGQYPDTWGAFVCLGEQPSCSPSPASYQLQI